MNKYMNIEQNSAKSERKWEEVILTFQSTNHAIKAERVLLDGGFSVMVMPLPSRIRAGCGLCLRLPPAQLAEGQALLCRARVPVDGIYVRREPDGKSEYAPYEGDIDGT